MVAGHDHRLAPQRPGPGVVGVPGEPAQPEPDLAVAGDDVAVQGGVEGAVIQRIARLAQRTPSAGFSQGQRLVVVTDQPTRVEVHVPRPEG